jgi:hypothetical protein
LNFSFHTASENKTEYLYRLRFSCRGHFSARMRTIAPDATPLACTGYVPATLLGLTAKYKSSRLRRPICKEFRASRSTLGSTMLAAGKPSKTTAHCPTSPGIFAAEAVRKIRRIFRAANISSRDFRHGGRTSGAGRTVEGWGSSRARKSLFNGLRRRRLEFSFLAKGWRDRHQGKPTAWHRKQSSAYEPRNVVGTKITTDINSLAAKEFGRSPQSEVTPLV